MKKLILILTAVLMLAGCATQTPQATPTPETTPEATTTPESTAKTDSFTGPTVDSVTSASIVQEAYIQDYTPAGFTDSDKEKALFVIGDPRHNSVLWDMARTAMKHMEEQGMEVEMRDLYTMNFNPVLSAADFYYAKDGQGEPSADIKKEQDLVSQADHLIFVYPNWHDSEITIVKGYKEKVFAKKFAYQDGANGLEGLLKDKSYFTIMNCGYLGGGRGYIGDGVGIEDEKWDTYMNAFKVFDDDTSAFWGTTNYGRFVNDRTPGNESENYGEEIEQLRSDLNVFLDKVYFN